MIILCWFALWYSVGLLLITEKYPALRAILAGILAWVSLAILGILLGK